jgi:hypothetical protein
LYSSIALPPLLITHSAAHAQGLGMAKNRQIFRADVIRPAHGRVNALNHIFTFFIVKIAVPRGYLFIRAEGV